MPTSGRDPLPGFRVTDNPMGFTSVWLHYSCDPDKNPDNPDPKAADKARAWLATQRRQWPDPNDFEREFEINFMVGKGKRVFPQFSQITHCAPYEYNKYRTLYRAWDFGWHCPVCLVAQVGPGGRLHIFREIVGGGEDTHKFAGRVVELCATWFPDHAGAAGFEDFCDPAGQQVKSMENERNERRDVEVLQGLGIHAKYEFGWSRKDQRTLVHRLLALRSDGTPGLLVDDRRGYADTIASAMLGRYVYPEKRDGTVAEEPDDDTHPWADVMAGVRYLVVGLQRKLGLARFAFAQAVPQDAPSGFHGYGTPKRK